MCVLLRPERRSIRLRRDSGRVESLRQAQIPSWPDRAESDARPAEHVGGRSGPASFVLDRGAVRGRAVLGNSNRIAVDEITPRRSETHMRLHPLEARPPRARLNKLFLVPFTAASTEKHGDRILNFKVFMGRGTIARGRGSREQRVKVCAGEGRTRPWQSQPARLQKSHSTRTTDHDCT